MSGKRVLVLWLCLLSSFWASIQFAQARGLWQASVDLNGDGKKEQVILKPSSHNHEKGPDYVLQIGKAKAKGTLDENITGFSVVDIDAQDCIKEIAVETEGPSDDYAENIYWFDGKQIKSVAEIEGSTKYTGKGIVYVRGWMGFWELTSRYLLDKKAHTLKETPQEFYHVGLNLKVGKSFPIFSSRDEANKKNGSVIADLRKGSFAQILLWDPKQKVYLIKAESNIIGWTKENNLYSLENLPIAD